MIKLKAYYAQTDQGPHLNINEDAYAVDLQSDFFLLVDGFGGSGVGDKAVKEIKENIKNFYTNFSFNDDATMPFYFSNKNLIEANALMNAFIYSHGLLCKENFQKPMSERAGASAVCAVRASDILIVLAVGNCRGYLYRKGRLEKIFIEESYRLLAPDQASTYYSTTPLSAFGLFEELGPELREVRLQEGDFFCFLTDGVYSRIEDHELKYFFDQSLDDLPHLVSSLFHHANDRGNLDNQSALFLRF